MIIPNYSSIIKKYKNKRRKRKIYVSTDALNKFGFRAKNLERNTSKLDEKDKSIIILLKSLKKNEIIEYFEWGINSHGDVEIYICPIIEGMKQLILDKFLQSNGVRKQVKNDFFGEDDSK